MPRRKYVIRPIGASVDESVDPFLLPAGYGAWGTENIKIDRHVAKKRWGYTQDRSAGFVYGIADFNLKDGTTYNLFFNLYDLCCRKTGGSETYSYITETLNYDAKIDSITDAANSVVTFKAGTTIQSDGAAAGDAFILDDDHTPNAEDDTAWLAIKTVDGETQCTLDGNYATNGTTGSWTGSEKSGLIRQKYNYDVPTDADGGCGEYRWNWAVVDDKFCFTNQGVDVQYWAGTGYAAALDSTNAKGAKYCIEYADRLVLANTEESGNRSPTTVRWSKNGDPTDWTDSTAGSVDLLESEEAITGLGKVGNDLVVFKRNSIVFGSRSGISTSPIIFPRQIAGIGCIAPYSIVHAMGTVWWVGADNIYKMVGSQPVPVGGLNSQIRNKIFDNYVAASMVGHTVGAHNPIEHEILWSFELSGPDIMIVAYDYINDNWNVYDLADNMLSGGKWYISGDRFYIGGHTNSICRVLSTTRNDNSTAIASTWQTGITDFSDQDPAAHGRWKTVYGARLIYRDKTTNAVFVGSIRPDGGSWTDDSETVGTASDDVKSIDFHWIKTAHTFDFKLYNSSATANFEWLSLEIFYELGGEFFNVS